MPIYLRQSTASQEIPLGYFVDSTDGDTAETALSIANTDIKIWKTGATTVANKNSGGATHISGGLYYCVLDATDTDTIGPLVVFVHVSGALAVRVECNVLDEAVYDVLYGTTALSTGTAPTAASIADAVWDEAIAGHLTAGSTGEALNAAGSAGDPWNTALPGAYAAGKAGYILGTNLDAAVTTRLAPTTAGRTLDVTATGEAGIDWSNIGAPTTTVNLSGTTVGHAAVVDSIAGNAINAAAIATDALGALELAADAVAEIADAVWDEVLSGHLTAGTTGAALNAAGSAGDPWLTALPGAYSAGSAGYIIGTNLNATVSSRLAPTVASRTLDVSAGGEAGIDWANIGSPTTSVGLSGTTVLAATSAGLTAAAVDAIWDEAQAGHTTAGTFGKYLDAQVSLLGASAAAIATAVWETTIDGYEAQGCLAFIAAATAGKVSGAGTGTETFRSVDDTANRIVSTADRLGNRTAITLTAP